MKKSSAPRQITRRTPSVDKASPLSTWASVSLCALILLSGFFFAARQHFSSMEYGMKNSSLRRQLDDLRAEKQRLLYTREVSLSPNEIKRAAKKAGVLNTESQTAPSIELASAKRENKPNPTSPTAVKPIVIKTGSVAPVAPQAERILQTVARIEKPEKPTRVSK